MSLSLVSAVFTQATALVIASELTSRLLTLMAIYWEASSHAPKMKVEKLNVCSRCNKTLGMLSWSMATIQDRRS